MTNEEEREMIKKKEHTKSVCVSAFVLHRMLMLFTSPFESNYTRLYVGVCRDEWLRDSVYVCMLTKVLYRRLTYIYLPQKLWTHSTVFALNTLIMLSWYLMIYFIKTVAHFKIQLICLGLNSCWNLEDFHSLPFSIKRIQSVISLALSCIKH